MTALFPTEPNDVPARPRRDGQVWESNFCFTHGYCTPWDKTCEGFRIYASEDCDVAPAVVRRVSK